MSTENSVKKAENDYVLGRDVAATVRLHVQHHYTGRTQGFQLDPKILDAFAHKTKDDPIMIADAGTGTAIWASEIASELGDRCAIDGVDISSALFPHETCVAKNVRLVGGINLLEELDPQITGKYDIVHARYFTLVIRHDAAPLINNLYKMCAPGGWVQYGDAHMAEHWVIYPDGIDPKDTEQGTQGVLDGFRNHLNILGIGGESYGWQKNLEKNFQDAGFVNIELSVHRAPEPYASYNSDQLLVLGEELAKGALSRGAESGVDMDAARQLLWASQAGKAESVRGIHMNWTLMTIRAQRPKES